MAGSRTFRVEREDGPDRIVKADEFRRHTNGRAEYVEFCDNETATGAQGEYTRHIPVATVRDPLLVEEVTGDAVECIITGDVREAAEHVVTEWELTRCTFHAAARVHNETGCGLAAANFAIQREIERRKDDKFVDGGPYRAGIIREAAERAVAKHGTGTVAANRVILDTGCNYFEAKAAVDAEIARRCTHWPKKVVATITLSPDPDPDPDLRRLIIEEQLTDWLFKSSYAKFVESVVVEVS